MWWRFALVWIAAAGFEVVVGQTSRRSQDGATRSGKVRLDVFYETNCPDSVRFITRQLYPVYREMKDAVDIHLIPYGKASEEYDSVSKKYVFKCQHGPAECYGNTVQACAMSLYPKVEDHLNFINCMQSYPRPSDNGDKCARRLSLDWVKISKCANGDEGNRLLHEQAVLTKALDPRLNFVPWIKVNGVHTNQLQRRSLQDLKGVVCDSYACQLRTSSDSLTQEELCNASSSMLPSACGLPSLCTGPRSRGLLNLLRRSRLSFIKRLTTQDVESEPCSKKGRI